MTDDGLLRYSISDEVEAFTTMRDAQLPFPVLCGYHVDLKAANRWLLESAGVLPHNIQISEICTYADPRFFSARREGYECGRNINAIRLIR